MNTRFPLMVLVSLTMLALLVMPVLAMNNVHRSALQWFSDGSMVRGANSKLTTSQQEAQMSLHSEGLQPYTAVTIWWVVFNHPEHCMHPTPFSRCGEQDLQIPPNTNLTALNATENESMNHILQVNASILFAQGAIVNKHGWIDARDSLSKDSTQGAIFGPGLTNPKGADIHFIIRSHGRLLPGKVKEQLSTFTGGCNNASGGTGVSGNNTCWNVQFSIHEQNTNVTTNTTV